MTFLLPILLVCGLVRAEEPEGPAVLQWAAEQELDRAMADLKLPTRDGPYLVSISILDGTVSTTSASLGVLDSSETGPIRMVRVDVRVGDYQLDNSNFEGSWGSRAGMVVRPLPTDDVGVAIRRELWLAIDEAYKGASEQLADKIASREGMDRDFPPDLTEAKPLEHEVPPPPPVDGAAMEMLVERLSGAVTVWPTLESVDAVARDWQGRRLLVSSEGTRAWLPTGAAVVRVVATARADDGARIRDARWWVARNAADLPSMETMEREVQQMGQFLQELCSAPLEDDYLGPVLFEQVAAVELFRQLVPAEISGSPPAESEPGLFGGNDRPIATARIGRRLLPEGWYIVDDPRSTRSAAGAYRYDHDGMQAKRVELVSDGVVRAVLMSRIPREEGDESTGHGRALSNHRKEALPAVVEVSPPRARNKRRLRRKARALGRQAGLEHVLIVHRMEPPALAEDFDVAFSGEGPLPGMTRPLEVTRLYTNGKEEPVRGLHWVGVDRRALRDVSAAGRVGRPIDVMDTHPGAGRFSVGLVGGLPATWAVPSVVVSEMELRQTSDRTPRAVPAPPVEIPVQPVSAPPPESAPEVESQLDGEAPQIP